MALGQPRVREELKEFGINGAYLAKFYQEMHRVVATGEQKAIATFAQEDLQFAGPAKQILLLGTQMQKHGRGFQRDQLGRFIALYRLTIGNVMNIFGSRETDLSTATQIHKHLQQLVEQASELVRHLNFERFPTLGFELVPKTRFDSLPVLQNIHVAFGENL